MQDKSVNKKTGVAGKGGRVGVGREEGREVRELETFNVSVSLIIVPFFSKIADSSSIAVHRSIFDLFSPVEKNVYRSRGVWRATSAAHTYCYPARN